jgi:hypothetical protein
MDCDDTDCFFNLNYKGDLNNQTVDLSCPKHKDDETNEADED